VSASSALLDLACHEDGKEVFFLWEEINGDIGCTGSC
jgi:hypothetical protein